MRRLIQRLLPLLPSAGSKLLALQRVENAQYFLDVPSDGEIVAGGPADCPSGIHDVSSAQADAGFFMQYSKGAGKVALEVGHHGKGQVFKLRVIVAPGQVGVLGVGAAAENFAIPVFKLAVLVSEFCDFSGAHEGEVERPEKHDLPLSFVCGVGDV